MKIGSLVLDNRCNYLIVYRNIKENTINTWTLQLSGLKVNYQEMKNDKNVEIVGVYKKLDEGTIYNIIRK